MISDFGLPVSDFRLETWAVGAGIQSAIRNPKHLRLRWRAAQVQVSAINHV